MYTKRIVTAMSSVMLTLTVLTGCATVDREKAASSPNAGRVETVNQREASDLAFQYRRQAAEYREMAYRLELEAQLYLSQKPDSPEVTQTLERAKSFRLAADQSDEWAREYRGQAPHNQVN